MAKLKNQVINLPPMKILALLVTEDVHDKCKLIAMKQKIGIRHLLGGIVSEYVNKTYKGDIRYGGQMDGEEKEQIK